MHDPILDTFLVVAEETSFSKAATKLYITPSAVSQKMTELEQNLGVTLFHRGSHGITLTEQGRLLKREGADFIEKGREIRQRLLAIENSKHVLYVGTSLEEKCRALFDMWMKYSELWPEDRISLISIGGSRGIPEETDIIECVCDGARWQQDWDFTPISSTALCVAVDRMSPYVFKKSLIVDNLVKQPVVVTEREKNHPAVNAACRELKERGGEILLRPGFTPEVIWEASSMHYPLLCPACWHEIIFDVEFLPVEWEHRFEYGLFHRKNISPVAKRFLRFAADECSSKDYLERYKRNPQYRYLENGKEYGLLTGSV